MLEREPGGLPTPSGFGGDPSVSSGAAPGSAAASTALAFGVVGNLVAFLPVIGMFALPLGLLAICFGIGGLLERDTSHAVAAALSGLLLGVSCLVLSVGAMHLLMIR